MKKFSVIALVLALTLSLGACGRRKNNSVTTTPTKDSTPITVPTMPDMTMPSTNIPDPTVDSNSTMNTENATDGTSGNTDPSSRMR